MKSFVLCPGGGVGANNPGLVFPTRDDRSAVNEPTIIFGRLTVITHRVRGRYPGGGFRSKVDFTTFLMSRPCDFIPGREGYGDKLHPKCENRPNV